MKGRSGEREGGKKMNCQLMEELISCYADGMLDIESADLVERHLERCERCRGLLEHTRELTEVCRGLQDDPPADLRACVMEHVRRRKDCERFEEQLALAADLPAEASEGLEAHLQDCRWCAREMEALSAILSAAPLAEESAPADLRERIAARTFARPAPMAALLRALAPSYRYAAAGTAVLAALAVLFIARQSPLEPPAAQDAMGREAAPPAVTAEAPSVADAGSPAAAVAEESAQPASSAASAPRRPGHTRSARAGSTGSASPASGAAAAAERSVPVAAPKVEEVIVLVAGSSEEQSAQGDTDAAELAEQPGVRPVTVAIASPEEVLARHTADDPLNTRMKEVLEQRRQKAAAGATVDILRGSRQSLRLIAADF